MLRQFSVTINGDKWLVRLMRDKDFIKAYGKDTEGITTYQHHTNYRTIDFKYSTLRKSTVTHEVTHAYLSYHDLSKLSKGDTEEKFADLLGYRAYCIVRVSNSIFRKLS